MSEKPWQLDYGTASLDEPSLGSPSPLFDYGFTFAALLLLSLLALVLISTVIRLFS